MVIGLIECNIILYGFGIDTVMRLRDGTMVLAVHDTHDTRNPSVGSRQTYVAVGCNCNLMMEKFIFSSGR